MFRQPASVLVGQPLDQLLPARLRDAHGSYIAAFRPGGEDDTRHPHVREAIARRADGSEFPVEISLSKTRVDAILLFTAVIRDVSERHQADLVRRRSEAFSLAILNSVAAEIAVVDRDGCITAVNQAWQQFGKDNAAATGGIPMGNGVGTNYLQACASEDGDLEQPGRQARDGIASVLAGRAPSFQMDYACHGPDHQRWFRMSVTPLGLEDGGVVIAHTDITEATQALTELRLAEERLRLAKGAARLGIYDRDLVTGTLTWDDRMRELWGLPAGEPVRLEMAFGSIHPDDRAPVQAALDKALSPTGDGNVNLQYRIVDPTSGEIRHMQVTGRILFAAGHPIRSIGTVKDISGQKRLEREIQERRGEMEELVKQQIAAHTAAAIAHELNQPLVSISAYSEAALRMLQGGVTTPEKLTRALSGAVEQAQRAGRTLHQLIDFLHKGELATEEIDLNALITEALLLAKETGYGDFHAIVKLEPNLRPVRGNRMQVQKVLLNLLHNGFEAMQEVGVPAASITISVRTSSEQDMALVTIQDSGPGVAPEIRQRIFEPFFTTKDNGIGLGLAISRTLIEAHGGQMWADLQDSPGATFHFTLPFAP